jgi:hypothetical protein
MLLKACKIIDMPCLMGGSGLAMMVYFCATGLRDMSVINGYERGTKLQYIKSIHEKDLRQLLKNHVFLDNETGDIYSYDGVILLQG